MTDLRNDEILPRIMQALRANSKQFAARRAKQSGGKKRKGAAASPKRLPGARQRAR